MTATVKSVLFVDYDSLYMSLRARDPGIARRFALNPGSWIDAIESGLLIDPHGDEPARRRILMRRCYADPKLLGKARGAFQAQGFQIVDCPPLPGRERNSAEIQMVLDTVDALGHQTGFEEFILLSADSDLTPVVFRLRSYNRSTTIYATVMTSGGYRAIADGAIDEQALIDVLAPTADAETPEIDDVDEEAVPGRPGHEKEELAVLARRIHQTANVPLYSPKVYAELFRALANEVAENGYHFQATAENVAARLVAAGRNASRRQVAFVVKGLALKGHVFSTNDSPEKLATVFKEQVLYLARSAGIETDDGVEQQIHAWIVGRNGSAEPAAPATRALPPKQEPQPVIRTTSPPVRLSPIPSPPPMPTTETPAPRTVRPISLQPLPASIPQPIRPIQVRPIPPTARPQPVAAEPPAPQPTAPPAPPEPAIIEFDDEPILVAPPAPAPAPVAPPQAARPEPVRREMPPAPQPAPVEETRPRASIAPPRPRLAPRPAVNGDASAEPARPMPPAVRPAVSRPPAASGAMRPPARRVASAPERPEEDESKDPIESSILAAIAEAVDVLVVEDGDEAVEAAPVVAEIKPAAPAPARSAVVPARPKAATPRPADPPADDADIGDEIQRILAAYSQNRKPPGK